MSQALLFVALQVLGFLVCLACGPHRRAILCCALGFPVGLATLVPTVILFLVIGVPYGLWTLVVIWLAFVAVATVTALRRGRIRQRTMTIAAAWTAVFAAICLGAAQFNASLMTFDSHTFVMIGGIIGDGGGFVAGTLEELHAWGVFQAICHSFASFVREPYLYSLPMVFAASFVAIFAICLWQGLQALGACHRWRTALVGLVVVAMATIYLFHLHFLYIHTNMSSAAYLFCFVVLYWFAEIEDDLAFLPIAFLCLVAFSLQRIEAPVVAFIFLMLTVLPSKLRRSTIVPWFSGFTVLLAAWYVMLATHSRADSQFLTPTKCAVVIGSLTALYLYWAVASPRLTRLNRYLPRLALVGCVLALAFAFALKTDHMSQSAHKLMANLTSRFFWGYSWYAMAALALAGMVVTPPPFRAPFTYGVLLYLGLIMVLVYAREPYRNVPGDSANRMVIHVVPLIFYYFGLKFLPLVAEAGYRRRGQLDTALPG